MRKIFLLTVCVLVATCLAYGQRDSAKGTFHIHQPEQKNGISFSVHCDKTDTVFKEIFVSDNGNYLFYWGSVNSPSSASFKADTISIWMVTNLLNNNLINILTKSSDSAEGYHLPCAYTIVTIKDGVVKNYISIPIDDIGHNVAGYDKVRRLAKVMQRLYAKYHFPK